MPLHKAFVLLEDEFLVESIPRKGIYVRKPDLTEIIDAFECREGLEGIAARRATASFTDTEIERLEALFSPFINVKEIDPVRYQKADRKFHESIINASGNNVLRRLNQIGSVLIRTYPRGIILPLEESMADHQKIIKAFRERDATEAEKLIRMHSYKARMLLEKELEMHKNNINE
jgi:DNA-binding GntR family transcriptional regulator